MAYNIKKQTKKQGDDIMIFGLSTALLDTCVLSILSKEDTYGYILTQNIKEVIDISETTLYPILRKLQARELLTTYDKPYQGRNRRYYKITELGKVKLEENLKEWETYKLKIDHILSGGIINE